jgi:amylosucrase
LPKLKAVSKQEISANRLKLAQILAGDPDLDSLLDRFDRWSQDLWDGIEDIYDAKTLLPQLIEAIARIHNARSTALRHRDNQRILQPDWFQDSKAIGYVCYTDLFAGDLQGIRKRIPYLKQLGITYLHLMPLLKPRPGNSDGGYAVMDYKSVRPDLGSMKDLAELAADLHEAGISLTLDLVLNHVAKEHEWAEKAKAGDLKYLDYFYTYVDRKVPDQYEKSLPEIFPTFAPGNFTYYEDMNRWVWTTFNEFQWDVNWSNPNLFLEYVDIIGYLANQGTDCVRLDAIAFIWKRLGTNCQNQPEVHSITQALRAISKIVTPSLIYKAEAIVGPQDVVHYLGQGEHAGKVSDLAYHNSLMVQIWSALAARDSRLLDTALSRFAPVPTSSAWATYLRCHDDIGWAIDDSDAAAAGVDGFGHRNFCADFYANEFIGSFARGVHFQSNPLTGDRRSSGSAASLIGIQRALENNDAADLNTAINRLICAYAIVFGFGGIPLLYMGDELGMLNDESYKEDPAKADDNRWIHRPKMDWDLATKAANGEGIAGRVYQGIENLIKVRKSLNSLHASVTAETEARNDGAILLIRRKHAAGLLTEIYNLTEKTQYLDSFDVAFGDRVEAISGRKMHFAGQVAVPPYAAWWIHA